MTKLALACSNVILILAVVFSFARYCPGSSAVARRLAGPLGAEPGGSVRFAADRCRCDQAPQQGRLVLQPFAENAFRAAPVIIAITTLLAFAVVPVAPGIGVVDLNMAGYFSSPCPRWGLQIVLADGPRITILAAGRGSGRQAQLTMKSLHGLS